MENTELLQQVTAKAEKWLNGAYNEEAKAEVRRMLEAEDKTELIECFYKDLEFGTGGLRGIMGTYFRLIFSLLSIINTAWLNRVSSLTPSRIFK